MLPSSISAPSTLVPMISAVSGSTTLKPNWPRNSGGHDPLRAIAVSSAEMAISRTAGIANSKRPLAAHGGAERQPMMTGFSTVIPCGQDASR